jgi:two-component system sensor histidine kinase and response regulator WspE
MSSGLEDFSIFELFRMEAEEQVGALQTALLRLENGESDAELLEALMRSAHSLKGAARIVGLNTLVTLTHAMEERFVQAQAGSALSSDDVTRMLAAVDWLAKLQQLPEAETTPWLEANNAAITALAEQLNSDATTSEAPAAPTAVTPAAPPPVAVSERIRQPRAGEADGERHVRLSVTRFDQILALASEVLVTARQLSTFADAMDRHRRAIVRAVHVSEDNASNASERARAQHEIERHAMLLAELLGELDEAARNNERTTGRLHRNVLASRLRPFSEGIGGVARIVRDTAAELGKRVQLEILGQRTRVDRDILDRLEAPIMHLVSNAIDHGIETPAERTAVGKPPEAKLRLHARHENGRLVVTLRDDGRGINRENLRAATIRRDLVSPGVAARLSDAELFEFLFLPGFSTRTDVSTISGRGVGLNAVQSMVQEAGGSVTVTSDEGQGTVFRMTLPVTRSVVKVILVEADGERFAIPLVRIDHVAQGEAYDHEGHLVVDTAEGNARVVSLAALLGLTHHPAQAGSTTYVLRENIAFAVDKLVDETEIPARHLDARLGRVSGVSAASLDENGVPLLILDIEDLLQTARGEASPEHTSAKEDLSLVPHILVVDDSHTVREIERRILVGAGYRVTTAQNGLEAWNMMRLNNYDLLVSDVDMPQMNGIELVSKVRANSRLERMPVIILSYKNRDEDRRRGLDAGADFYLTKGDFENESFLRAVVDLIGESGMAHEARP